VQNVECSCCRIQPADGKHPYLMTLKHGGQAGVYPLCEACHVEVDVAARRLAISGHSFRLRESALLFVKTRRALDTFFAKQRVHVTIEPCRLEMSYC
jgi:hypothetical protein